jgi:hypothetical protein
VQRLDDISAARAGSDQPEADTAGSCASARRSTGWSRATRPVGDEPPERRERVSDSSNTRPPAISKHDVDRLPSLASRSASARSSRRDVDGRVGAELERQRALVLARGGGDHAAGAERPAELDGERADAAGRRVHDDALAAAQLRRRLVQVPGGQPWMSSASAAASLTPSGIGNVARAGAATYSA